MTKVIERVQTGVRIEKRLLKVLKGLAEHFDDVGFGLFCRKADPYTAFCVFTQFLEPGLGVGDPLQGNRGRHIARTSWVIGRTQ